MEELQAALSKVQNKKVNSIEFNDIICKIADILQSLYSSLPPEVPLVAREVLYLLMTIAKSLCKILSDPSK